MSFRMVEGSGYASSSVGKIGGAIIDVIVSACVGYSNRIGGDFPIRSDNAPVTSIESDRITNEGAIGAMFS